MPRHSAGVSCFSSVDPLLPTVRSTTTHLFKKLVHRFNQAPGPTRAIVWALLGGFTFSVMNMLLRKLSQQMNPFEAQFLRHMFGLAVLLPFILRSGIAQYKPSSISGQITRGAVHTLAISLWFFALPHLALADTTAISFTGPIFTMIGAAYLLGEAMRRDRWIAAIIGFIGVLIVVGPRLAGNGGWYYLVMLASAPIFSLSSLLNKILTRKDSPQVIVAWQTLVVSCISLPMAIAYWVWPTPTQWLIFACTGLFGSISHLCITHALKAADISVSQSVNFLNLVWATIWGFLVFGDMPSENSLIGGLVIVGATLWISRREARRSVAAGAP
jgi:drug/metabolite transporter (DMT)-like permease